MTSPTATPRANTQKSSGIRAALFAPIDIGMLVVFRVIFGAAMVFELSRFFSHGWITRYFVDPPLYFTYYGFSWVRPLPQPGMTILFVVLIVCAALITVGLFYRLASVLFFLGFAWIFLLDQSRYLNHFYLIVLLSFLLMFLPAHRAWSVDCVWRPQLRRQQVPAWTLWLLRFQLGVVYFFGGVAKMSWDWVSGVPMQIMLLNGDSVPFIDQYFDRNIVVYAFAWGGMLFDLLIVPLLLWNRTRLPAYFGLVFFHTFNAKLFTIGIFPLVMVAASMIFFPPEWLKPEGSDNDSSRTDDATDDSSVSGGHQTLICALLCLYASIQILLPLRHVLYPGYVSWTEEGHRFAWHMKLRAKRSNVTFRAQDADGNELTDFVQPKDYLQERQYRVMAGRPDMVLQYAHHLADDFRSRGIDGVRIYADSSVRLNRRPAAPLINPDVDLASQPRDLKHADWLMPLTGELPSLEEVRAITRERAQQKAEARKQPASNDGRNTPDR